MVRLFQALTQGLFPNTLSQYPGLAVDIDVYDYNEPKYLNPINSIKTEG